MFPIQDQISVAAKANLEANLALYNSLTAKALQSVEQLITLNLAAAKASMEESSAVARQLLTAKDPQECISLVTSQARPNLEKMLAYGNHLAGIASSVQAEYTKAAETQMAEISRKTNELMDAAASKAPAGSESLVAMMKSALGNASSGYEQLSRTGKQAVEALEANLNAAVGQLSHVVEQVPAAKA
jgi:phasin family protein